ncbi:MAG TPA: hypothetical protein VKU80_01395 [Planctomycetota bacterium]|nr:hypothetical protein [Planctomycetota bacterium]
MLMLVLLLSAAQDADYFPLQKGNELSFRSSNGQTMTRRVGSTAQIKGVECISLQTERGSQKTREWLALAPTG